MKPLDPPDPERCQAEHPVGPFRMGGRIGAFERCHERPEVIATEVEPGADGRIGAMSLCAKCLEVFLGQKGSPAVVVSAIPS